MIGKQLDLFGGAPMPPKKILVEEEPEPELSEAITVPVDTTPDTEMPEPKAGGFTDAEQLSTSDVFVQMPEGANESLIITTGEQVDEIPDWVGEAPALQLDEPASIETETEIMTDFEPMEQESVEKDVEIEADVIRAEYALDIPGEKMHEGETSEIDEAPPVADEGVQITESLEKGLNIPADDALYSRQYYTMRETAAMFHVNQSLLRFWENEFDILKPKKNRKGDRYFRPEDIKNLELIYHLLRVRKFTIEGAKDYLKSKAKSMQTFEMVQRLEKLKLFLQELKTTI